MRKPKKLTLDQVEKQLIPKGNKKDTRPLHASGKKADFLEGLGGKAAINPKKGSRQPNAGNNDDNDPSGNHGGGVGFGGMDGGYLDFDGYDAESHDESGGSGKSGKSYGNTIKKSKRAKYRK
jgi:hypothetical protein